MSFERTTGPRLPERVIFFCLFVLLAAPTAWAEKLQWSGSLKSLNIYGEEAPARLAPEYKISSNRARLNATWQPDDPWQLDAAMDYQYLWSDPAGVTVARNIDYNRKLDLEKRWQHHSHGEGLLQVDRFSLQWRTGAVDTTIGRQAIGFGRILIFSPLDVIAPFAPDAIDTDIRSGVDALRTVFNYGLDGQLGGIAVFGEESEYNSFFGTWSDNRSGLDLLLIGGELRGRRLIGAGVAGSLGTLGLKGEVSFYDGVNVNQTGGDLSDSYAIAALEAWYRFENGLSLVTQYLYNGPGSSNPDDYAQVLASAPLQEGLTYLLGRHYLFVAPSYELHPLATLQGLVLYNIDDQSALIRPTLELSLADNLSVQAFWTWNVGQHPRAVAPFLPVVPESEFGSLGDSGGLFLRCFF